MTALTAELAKPLSFSTEHRWRGGFGNRCAHRLPMLFGNRYRHDKRRPQEKGAAAAHPPVCGVLLATVCALPRGSGTLEHAHDAALRRGLGGSTGDGTLVGYTHFPQVLLRSGDYVGRRNPVRVVPVVRYCPEAYRIFGGVGPFARPWVATLASHI